MSLGQGDGVEHMEEAGEEGEKVEFVPSQKARSNRVNLVAIYGGFVYHKDNHQSINSDRLKFRCSKRTRNGCKARLAAKECGQLVFIAGEHNHDVDLADVEKRKLAATTRLSRGHASDPTPSTDGETFELLAQLSRMLARSESRATIKKAPRTKNAKNKVAGAASAAVAREKRKVGRPKKSAVTNSSGSNGSARDSNVPRLISGNPSSTEVEKDRIDGVSETGTGSAASSPIIDADTPQSVPEMIQKSLQHLQNIQQRINEDIAYLERLQAAVDANPAILEDSARSQSLTAALRYPKSEIQEYN